MKWAEMLELEDCDLCPLKKAEICPGGFTCYGGAPIEPPCTCFDDDTDLDEWVEDFYERQKAREDYEDKRIQEEKRRKERAERAAKTKRELKLYCLEEINAIHTIKKCIAVVEAQKRIAESLSFAINATNEMFRYTERVSENPVFGEELTRLNKELEDEQRKYEEKRKAFYENREKLCHKGE